MASNIKVDIVRPTATNGSLSLKGDSGGAATTNGVTVNSSGNTAITGTTTISSLVATTADINGGTIDGVTLGINSAITEAQVDNINIDSNTISSTNTDGDIILSPNGSGHVGIGTSSPKAQQHVFGLGQTTAALTDAGNRSGMLRVSDNNNTVGSGGAIVFANSQGDTANSVGFAAIKGLLADGGNNTNGHLAFSTRTNTTDTALTECMRIDSDGNLKFDSGYGSVATAYGCRAWVNFRGTSQSGTATASGLVSGQYTATVTSASQFTVVYSGTTYTINTSGNHDIGNGQGVDLTVSGTTVTIDTQIRASGNVSSITDNGTGTYTITFATAMPDANYAFSANAASQFTNNVPLYAGQDSDDTKSTTALQIRTVYNNAIAVNLSDSPDVNVVIFR